MIKIFSGWSNRGGSTTAIINLTNELNKLGYQTKFYGPHTWHLDKCNAGIINPNLKIFDDDIVITHFITLPRCGKKFLLYCHEKDLFKLNNMEPIWDEVIFINNNQRDYHSKYTGKFSIIPNLRENLIKHEKTELDLVAGVIGSFDFNKQTHISIQRALDDGCEKVLLFGNVSENEYFNTYVKPLLSEKVILVGFIEDKQKMYDMIGRVYLSSLSEVASLVRDECFITNTKFFGNAATEHNGEILTNEEIMKLWINTLEL